MMKHLNSISQINLERDREMLRLYRKAREVATYPTTSVKLCEIVASLPTSCYYISDTSAARYVSNRLKGKIPKFGVAFEKKRMLYEAFYIDFLKVRKMEGNQRKCISQLVDIALLRPAPCLGLSCRSIRQKISAHLNKSKGKLILAK